MFLVKLGTSASLASSSIRWCMALSMELPGLGGSCHGNSDSSVNCTNVSMACPRRCRLGCTSRGTSDAKPPARTNDSAKARSLAWRRYNAMRNVTCVRALGCVLGAPGGGDRISAGYSSASSLVGQ